MNPPQYQPTEAQLRAREAFDLEAVLAALPPDEPPGASTTTYRGRAGIKLRSYLVADISDALLREFALDTLGAQRCSESYLDALRVVLGNQADSERFGYDLEMNIRTSFASERTMRTIIDQMEAAGRTRPVTVVLGPGKKQVVQVFKRDQSQEFTEVQALRYLEEKAHGFPVSEGEGCASERIPSEDVPY